MKQKSRIKENMKTWVCSFNEILASKEQLSLHCRGKVGTGLVFYFTLFVETKVFVEGSQ
jgi:hypothetical protein